MLTAGADSVCVCVCLHVCVSGGRGGEGMSTEGAAFHHFRYVVG